MSSKKVKNRHIPKSALPEILLSYDYDKNVINLYFWLSILAFVMLQTFFTISVDYIILTIFIIGSLFLLGIWIFLSRKTLNDEKDENFLETASELISYFNEKGKKVNKKIKIIVESIKKATKNYDRFFWVDKINKNLVFFILLLFLPLNFIILIQYRIFNFLNINESALWTYYIIEFFSLFYFIIYFGFRKRDYTNLSISVEYFKQAIENELLFHMEKIHEITYTKTKNVELRYDEINIAMNNWYDVYCCTYFSNETLNELLRENFNLIFNDEEEKYYSDIFYDFKFRLKDYMIYKEISINGNDEKSKNLRNVIEKLENFIALLDKSIENKKAIKKEKREKLITVRTLLYIIFGSISLGISVVGLLF